MCAYCTSRESSYSSYASSLEKNCRIEEEKIYLFSLFSRSRKYSYFPAFYYLLFLYTIIHKKGGTYIAAVYKAKK